MAHSDFVTPISDGRSPEKMERKVYCRRDQALEISHLVLTLWLIHSQQRFTPRYGPDDSESLGS